ncbi:hypothetical protein KCP69_13995 [Salmonella enterica subsp. enterica]|nr:hypothetical protein KCP69_13995 [Salmonella enterica subsp. enterica]
MNALRSGCIHCCRGAFHTPDLLVRLRLFRCLPNLRQWHSAVPPMHGGRASSLGSNAAAPRAGRRLQ